MLVVIVYDFKENREKHFQRRVEIEQKQIEGSGSKEVIADQETGDPILVISDIIELNAEEVRDFLAGNPDTLHFKLFASHDASGREAQEYAMNVPFSSSQWMKDRIIPVHQRLEIEGDPDIKELVLENIKITTLNTFAELRLEQSADYGLDLDLTGDAVRLTDDHGKTYPLKTYRTKYQPANEKFQPGVIELAFNSSPFFDETVKSLTLHIGNIKVSDWTRSDSFTLSLNENMPKPIRFKGKEMAIAQARYEDGFLKLHVRQPEKDRMSVRFRIPTFQPEGELRDTYYGEKADQRKDLLVPAEGTDAYDLSIMAPQQETYEIRMMRETDAVRIDRTLNIDLSP